MNTFFRIGNVSTCCSCVVIVVSLGTIWNNQASVMCFIDDCLFCHCYSTHSSLRQYSISMSQFVAQINESQFLVKFVQQCCVLSVVFNKLSKVLIIQLIQCAFIHCLSLANLNFADSIQSIGMAFFVGVFSIQFQ